MTEIAAKPYPRYSSTAVLIDVDQLDTKDRIRIDYGDLDELAESIQSNGLIQPIVINNEHRLIAGGRRFRAMTDILHLTQVPCVFLETLDEVHLRVLEAEENIQRRDLSWQETICAIAEIHRIKSLEAVFKRENWTLRSTGRLLNRSLGSIANAVTLARYIRASDPDILKAPHAVAALQILVERKELETSKHLASITGGKLSSMDEQDSKPRIITEFTGPTMNYLDDETGLSELSPRLDDDEDPSAPQQTEAAQRVTVPISRMLYNKDMREMLGILKAGVVDHIVTDIPYGIDMDMLSQNGTGMNIESVREEHDVESNLELFPIMFEVFDHVLADDGFIVMWYDLDHHGLLQTLARKHGFRVQRWPIVWVKTHPCKNQAAQYNWTKATEVAMVLRRPAATLVEAQTVNYILASNAALADKLGHPFVKPKEVWNHIYSAIAIRGQTVWDPFAGVGSATLAAIEQGLTPIATEINEAHYNRLVENVTDAYKRILNGEVVFS